MDKIIVNVETDEETRVPLTAAEVTDAKARAADMERQSVAAATAATKHTAALATVRAKAATDPAFAALLVLLGEGAA